MSSKEDRLIEIANGLKNNCPLHVDPEIEGGGYIKISATLRDIIVGTLEAVWEEHFSKGS